MGCEGNQILSPVALGYVAEGIGQVLCHRGKPGDDGRELGAGNVGIRLEGAIVEAGEDVRAAQSGDGLVGPVISGDVGEIIGLTEARDSSVIRR